MTLKSEAQKQKNFEWRDGLHQRKEKIAGEEEEETGLKETGWGRKGGWGLEKVISEIKLRKESRRS